MLTTIILLLLLMLYGILEYRSHLLHLRKLPIRIHVNGTRGKSSVTRLIAAGLRAGGKNVVAKITGTKPRFILEDGEEIPIYRFGTPNIIEQLTIVRMASERKAEILVVECMAVQPHLQWVSEERMILSTTGVITNAREDHLDQMGPTVKDVAEALSTTIPQKGILFTADSLWFPLFNQVAQNRGTSAVCTDSEIVSPEELNGFSYLEHPENVGLALKVCEHFGVSRSIALSGMHSAAPDHGALKAYHLRLHEKTITFYNAFAANDRESTILVYERLGLRNKPEDPVMVIINNRGDRLQRAEQFGHMMAQGLDAHSFFLVGEFTRATEDIAIRDGVPPDRIVNLGDTSSADLLEAILTRTERQCVVLGIGNIGGLGENIVDYFKNRGEEWLKRQSA